MHSPVATKKRKTLGLVVIITGLSILFAGLASAASPKVTIEPKKPGPGDIAVVTVRNAAGPVEGSFNGTKLHFNSFGTEMKAMVGVDLNLEPGKYALDLTINGNKHSRSVKVVKKEYPIQRLTLPKDKVELSPEDEARADREQAMIYALWPVESERYWEGNFANPLPGNEIGTPFGLRRLINNIPKSPHTGMDVRAKEGEPIHAPNNGVVALLDDLFFSGNSVIVDHGQGIYTMFFHLSKVNVKLGDKVKKGDVIGLVGETGRATGPHLHWGVRMQGARVDPAELMELKLE